MFRGMLEIIVYVVLSTFSDSDANALRSTAPAYLTVETAREHLLAARVAAFATGTNADDLLSIAWHESRYQFDVFTPEGSGWWYANDGAGPRGYARQRFSCGVMTPNPKPQCDQSEFTPLGGYLAGARHLAVWYRSCGGNRVCALNGYAGNATDRQVPGFKTWEVFVHRASWIKRARRTAKKRNLS